jgi:hypothetical protein
MRDSKTVEEIRDMRLRNGSWTLDRYRADIGEPPVDGGDQAVLVDRQNLVMWADMDAASKAGIAMKLKGTALEPGDPQHGAPVTVEKPEPAPVPPQLAFARREAAGRALGARRRAGRRSAARRRPAACIPATATRGTRRAPGRYR